MEFLKKISITGILLFLTFLAYPQNFQEKVKAFQNSYLQEASGNYHNAIESLRKVYQEDSYEVNLRLGYLCYLNGNFTESAAYYNNAVKLMPYAVEAKMGLVLPLSAMGNYSQMLEIYDEILEITPNNSVVLHRIGLIHYGREDYLSAQRYFQRVVNLYPFDYDALTMLAWTKLKLGRSQEAKILFQKAILNTPNGSTALEGLDLLSEKH